MVVYAIQPTGKLIKPWDYCQSKLLHPESDAIRFAKAIKQYQKPLPFIY